MRKNTSNSRAVAAQVLLSVVEQQQSLTALLKQGQAQVQEKDQGLLQALCFGVCRHYWSINAATKMMLDKPLPDKAKVVHYLICVGLFQLEHSDIQPHAAIHDTVEGCEALGFANLKGLVNALLRRYQRERDSLIAQLDQSDVTRLNHPKWLIKQLKKNWPQHWQGICADANQHPPMTLRVNTHLSSRSDYSLTIKESGIEANECSISDHGINLSHPVSVDKLPKFDLGFCSVQDEAAQLAALILAPNPNHKVLDACSAPGGKTGHLLEVTKGQSRVLALDADPLRLERVQQNLDRLAYKAQCVVGDAQSPEDWWDGEPFDRILLDVPCSATGVIRRHPDIKLLRQKDDIAKLALLQQSILQKIWPLLKPGGQLLYATCSILSEENSNNIALFLQEQSDANLLPINERVTQLIESSHMIDTGYGWQLFPKQNHHDGFFYSLLEKQKTT